MSRLILALTFCALSLCSVQSKDTIKMASHLAIYDLQLDSATEQSGISGLTGRMAYAFQDSVCEGYKTHFRFVTRIATDDLPDRLTDQEVENYEAFNGQEFRFQSRTKIDQEITNETNGVATIKHGKMMVKLTKPEESEHYLQSADFPTVQTKEVIRRAKAGEHFYQTTLFDGSEEADSLTQATVFIGQKKEPVSDHESDVLGELGQEEYWPVTISYFDDKEHQDGLPIYSTSFKLYENGVTRDLVMDYGTFVVRGKLTRFEMIRDKIHPPQDLPKNNCVND
ncbi:EipB family protein [Bartonella tamiae]|uniref:ATP-binding protein n=1 Tax=Bartonella tamiae Th239 TaxID=1094558 RepID=J1JVP4_9HYPH|nr:DUF1849 family protein [Bartonella tamiae]EJF88625.1 hypothetical protein ME5_01176 [Bartonella tamiae Th239]EJF95125.1 hypothetical protein MEG_00706 [Bartonella tamiae Th307]